MAMIRLREGAWLHWRGCRWLFERRSDAITEWRAQDGSLRHAQLTDREIASKVCSSEAILHTGHGRPPAVPDEEKATSSAPSPFDLEEGRRRLEYVREIHNRGLLRPDAGPEDWNAAIGHVHSTVGAGWCRLRGSSRGEPLPAPSLKSMRRWVVDAGVRPSLDALVPQHRRKGNRTDRIEEAVRSIVDDAVQTHWLRQPAIGLDDLKTHVHTAVLALNAKLPAGERPYAMPGDEALRTSIAAIPPKTAMRARHGEMAAFLKFGSGEVLEDPEAPLDVVELDSTVADLFVVCSRTGLPLGRPTIVICIDRCTRMVLGWICTFERPSISTLMQALRHAIMPKDHVARMNEDAGWNIRHDCETYGIPRELRIDRGLENLTTHLRELGARIGILRIRTLARKSPWLKGCVERTIRTMSERLLHPTPGTTLHNALMRMDYNPVKEAVCTTDDLDWALHKYFIDVYPRDPRRTLGNARAIDAWRRKTAIHPVDLPSTFEETSHLFGMTDSAVHGRHGIRANSMSYFSRELLGLLDDATYVKALRRNGGRLVYHLDPSDIGSIVVELPHEQRQIVVPVARKWRDYATGLSLYAHRKIRDFTLAQSRDANATDDLLACKAELLEIMRGSFGRRGRIADRQRAVRFGCHPPASGPGKVADDRERAGRGADATTTERPADSMPVADPLDVPTEAADAPQTAEILVLATPRRKKGFKR